MSQREKVHIFPTFWPPENSQNGKKINDAQGIFSKKFQTVLAIVQNAAFLKQIFPRLAKVHYTAISQRWKSPIISVRLDFLQNANLDSVIQIFIKNANLYTLEKIWTGVCVQICDLKKMKICTLTHLRKSCQVGMCVQICDSKKMQI